jgi:amidophosphoribosyltransferase
MVEDISTNPFADDKLHEECGIFGIWGKPDAAAFIALGLHALQHRGQEASGIVTCSDGKFYMERREGLVGDQFSVGGPIDKLKGLRHGVHRPPRRDVDRRSHCRTPGRRAEAG